MPIAIYLNQSVVLKLHTGFDVHGKRSLGSANTIEARFVEKEEMLKDQNGNEFRSDAQMWVLPEQSIDLEDEVAYGGSNYKAVKIEMRRGLTGSVDHKKVYLKKTKE